MKGNTRSIRGMVATVLALTILFSPANVYVARATGAEAEMEATVDPTAEPTATPTAEPTADPTATPTADPTATPTADPTADPTATPTAEPTADPTADPTATPTAAPLSEAVLSVQAQLDALPGVDELSAMTDEEVMTAMEAVDAAYSAYLALSPEEQALIIGAEKFDAISAWYSSGVSMMADTELPVPALHMAYILIVPGDSLSDAYVEGYAFDPDHDNDEAYRVDGVFVFDQPDLVPDNEGNYQLTFTPTGDDAAAYASVTTTWWVSMLIDRGWLSGANTGYGNDTLTVIGEVIKLYTSTTADGEMTYVGERTTGMDYKFDLAELILTSYNSNPNSLYFQYVSSYGTKSATSPVWHFTPTTVTSLPTDVNAVAGQTIAQILTPTYAGAFVSRTDVETRWVVDGKVVAASTKLTSDYDGKVIYPLLYWQNIYTSGEPEWPTGQIPATGVTVHVKSDPVASWESAAASQGQLNLYGSAAVTSAGCSVQLQNADTDETLSTKKQSSDSAPYVNFAYEMAYANLNSGVTNFRAVVYDAGSAEICRSDTYAYVPLTLTLGEKALYTPGDTWSDAYSVLSRTVTGSFSSRLGMTVAFLLDGAEMDRRDVLTAEDDGKTVTVQYLFDYSTKMVMASATTVLNWDAPTPTVTSVSMPDAAYGTAVKADTITGTVVDTDGAALNGAWSITDEGMEGSYPEIGEYTLHVKFTPATADYKPVQTEVTLTVIQATPAVTVTGDFYVISGDTLATGDLSALTVTAYNPAHSGETDWTVAGTLALTDSTAIPEASGNAAAVFTPADTTHYLPADVEIPVRVIGRVTFGTGENACKASWPAVADTAAYSLALQYGSTTVTIVEEPSEPSYDLVDLSGGFQNLNYSGAMTLTVSNSQGKIVAKGTFDFVPLSITGTYVGGTDVPSDAASFEAGLAAISVKLSLTGTMAERPETKIGYQVGTAGGTFYGDFTFYRYLGGQIIYPFVFMQSDGMLTMLINPNTSLSYRIADVADSLSWTAEGSVLVDASGTDGTLTIRSADTVAGTIAFDAASEKPVTIDCRDLLVSGYAQTGSGAFTALVSSGLTAAFTYTPWSVTSDAPDTMSYVYGDSVAELLAQSVPDTWFTDGTIPKTASTSTEMRIGGQTVQDDTVLTPGMDGKQLVYTWLYHGAALASHAVTLLLNAPVPTVESAAIPAITYGQAVDEATVTGSVIGTDGAALAGVWTILDENVNGSLLNAGSYTLHVRFTPMEANYKAVDTTVLMTVATAVPVIENLTAAVVSGKALSAATTDWDAYHPSHVGDAAWEVAGTLTFADPDEVLTGSKSVTVTFTPDETAQYEAVTLSVTVSVVPALTLGTGETAGVVTFTGSLSEAGTAGGTYELGLCDAADPSDFIALQSLTDAQGSADLMEAMLKSTLAQTDWTQMCAAIRDVNSGKIVSASNVVEGYTVLSCTGPTTPAEFCPGTTTIGDLSWDEVRVLGTFAKRAEVQSEYVLTGTDSTETTPGADAIVTESMENNTISQRFFILSGSTRYTQAVTAVRTLVWPAVAATLDVSMPEIYFGQKVDFDTFVGAATDGDGNAVSGTWTLTSPDETQLKDGYAAHAGTYAISVAFTPDDLSQARPAQTTLSFTVAMTEAVVTYESIGSITYGQTFSDVTFAGQHVTNLHYETGATFPDGTSAFLQEVSPSYINTLPSGISSGTLTFWPNAANQPLAGTRSYTRQMYISLEQTTDYALPPNAAAGDPYFDFSVPVTVLKAVPVVTNATATMDVGMDLQDALVSYTAVNPYDAGLTLTGTFQIASGTLTTAGTQTVSALFVPSAQDADNYESVDVEVTVTVNACEAHFGTGSNAGMLYLSGHDGEKLYVDFALGTQPLSTINDTHFRDSMTDSIASDGQFSSSFQMRLAEQCKGRRAGGSTCIYYYASIMDSAKTETIATTGIYTLRLNQFTGTLPEKVLYTSGAAISDLVTAPSITGSLSEFAQSQWLLCDTATSTSGTLLADDAVLTAEMDGKYLRRYGYVKIKPYSEQYDPIYSDAVQLLARYVAWGTGEDAGKLKWRLTLDENVSSYHVALYRTAPEKAEWLNFRSSTTELDLGGKIVRDQMTDNPQRTYTAAVSYYDDTQGKWLSFSSDAFVYTPLTFTATPSATFTFTPGTTTLADLGLSDSLTGSMKDRTDLTAVCYIGYDNMDTSSEPAVYADDYVLTRDMNLDGKSIWVYTDWNLKNSVAYTIHAQSAKVLLTDATKPIYTVTIPASTTLDSSGAGTLTIAASVTAGTVHVSVRSSNDFVLVGDETFVYYTLSTQGNVLANGNLVASFTEDGTAVLNLSAAEKPTVGGTYVDTLLFTVSADPAGS